MLSFTKTVVLQHFRPFAKVCICVAVDSCKVKCKADDFRSKYARRMNSHDCACIYTMNIIILWKFSFTCCAIYLIYNELTIISDRIDSLKYHLSYSLFQRIIKIYFIHTFRSNQNSSRS